MNSDPINANYVIIGIKTFVILIYLGFRPYINGFFDFFKILQEFHYILISIFLIKIQNKSNFLNNLDFIRDSELDEFFGIGESLIDTIVSFIFFSFFAFLNSLFYSISHSIDNYKY
jgi:hypothetical protein